MRTTDLDEAAACLQRGGVLLYPTRTLWGIGCDARLPDAVARVQAAKGRDPTRPFLVLLADDHAVEALCRCVPPGARVLMAALWPGELTLLLPAAPGLPEPLVGPEGLVGLRLATHPGPVGLLERTGAWLVSTSANPAGEPPPIRLAEIVPRVQAAADLLLDVPPPPSGVQSTIVAVPERGLPRLVRAGAVPEEAIRAVVQLAA